MTATLDIGPSTAEIARQIAILTAERDAALAERDALRAAAAIAQCQCGPDEACAFVRERDAAIARAERAEAERNQYAGRAAEWLAEKHLADDDHASDVEIVREQALRWAAEQVREERALSNYCPAIVEALIDRIERGPS